MLSVNNLTFRYRRHQKEILSDFGLRLEQGGVYGLLGPNGAGKSTLLLLMAGLLTPQKGNVTLDGTDTRLRRPETLAGIFLVPEEVSLPHLSFESFVSINSPFYPDFDKSVLDICLDEFGFRPESRIDNLSMGQRKKIMISFALACNTPVVLMDEPTNGLDIPGKSAFRRLVARLMTDQRIFIISTHQVRDLEQLLDHILIMDTSRLILDSDIASVQQKLGFIRNAPSVPANAIYSLPAPGGYDLIVRNDGNEPETDVNLEILFDFALRDNNLLNNIISRNNPQ